MITPDGVKEDFPIRFLVFAGDEYYPDKGANSLFGMFKFINEAEDAVTVAYRDSDWAHIYDMWSDKIIYTVDRYGVIKSY